MSGVLDNISQNWPKGLSQNNFFKKFFGDYRNQENEIIEKSSDINSGAVVNEIEFARKCILSHVQNRDVENSNGSFLDYLIAMTLGWKRGYDQDDDDYIRDFMLVLYRSGADKRVTKEGILPIANELFSNAEIIESIEKYQRYGNSYFEADFDGWDSDASLSRDAAFFGVNSVVVLPGEQKYLCSQTGVSYDMSGNEVADYPFPRYVEQDKAKVAALKAAQFRFSFFALDTEAVGTRLFRIAVKSAIGDDVKYIDLSKMERSDINERSAIDDSFCLFGSSAGLNADVGGDSKWQHYEYAIDIPVSDSAEQFFVEIISCGQQRNPVYIDYVELYDKEENPCFTVIAKAKPQDEFGEENGQKWRGSDDADKEIPEKEGEDYFNGVKSVLKHPDYVYSSKKIKLPTTIEEIKGVKEWKYKTWLIGVLSRAVSSSFVAEVFSMVKAAGIEYEIQILS